MTRADMFKVGDPDETVMQDRVMIELDLHLADLTPTQRAGVCSRLAFMIEQRGWDEALGRTPASTPQERQGEKENGLE